MPNAIAVPPTLSGVSARSGSRDVRTGEPQARVEETPRGKLLRVRVPLKEPLFSPLLWPQRLAAHGLEVRLRAEPEARREAETRGCRAGTAIASHSAIAACDKAKKLPPGALFSGH